MDMMKNRSFKILMFFYIAILVTVSIIVRSATAPYMMVTVGKNILLENHQLAEIDYEGYCRVNNNKRSSVESKATPKTIQNPQTLQGFASVQRQQMAQHFVATPAGLNSWTDDGRGLATNPLAYVPPENPNVNKVVLGFVPYWIFDGHYQNYRMQYLSDIAFFGIASLADGTFDTGSGWSRWNGSNMPEMISLAHASGVKVVPVVSNFVKSSIETFLNNNTNRTRLVNNIVAQINAKNADGVNIDFEYIGTASDTLRGKFTSFVDQVADAVHAARPGSHVSVDILASSGQPGASLLYDVHALAATSVDYIVVMEYDFHTTNSTYAGPVAPLYGDQYWYTVSESVRDTLLLMSPNKFIMGIPYYGLEVPVTSGTWRSKNGLRSGNAAHAYYAHVVGPESETWHCPANVMWDEAEKMRWYRYRYPDPSTGPGYWQGYYDDLRSLGAKYDLLYQKQLAGIGIWALDYDEGFSELWGLIRDRFSKESFLVVFKPGVTRQQQQSIHTSLGATVVTELNDESSVVLRPVSKLSNVLMDQYRARAEVAGVSYYVERSLSGQ